MPTGAAAISISKAESDQLEREAELLEQQLHKYKFFEQIKKERPKAYQRFVDNFGESPTLGAVRPKNPRNNRLTHEGTGLPNCCASNCGLNTTYGGKPVMWDQDAVEPFRFEEWRQAHRQMMKTRNYCGGHGQPACTASDYQNGKRPHSRVRKKTSNFMFQGFPAGCMIPKGGIPQGAHIIRVSPCGSDEFCQGTACMMVKVMRGEKTAFVQGWGEALKAVVQQTTVDKWVRKSLGSTGFLLPTAQRCHLMWTNSRFVSACKSIRDPTLKRAVVHAKNYKYCKLAEAAQESDIIIRDAVAELRFRIAEEQMKKLQKATTNPESQPNACSDRKFQALVRSRVNEKARALETKLKACSHQSEDALRNFQLDHLGEGFTPDGDGCSAVVREVMDQKAKELRRLLEQCQKAPLAAP